MSLIWLIFSSEKPRRVRPIRFTPSKHTGSRPASTYGGMSLTILNPAPTIACVPTCEN